MMSHWFRGLTAQFQDFITDTLVSDRVKLEVGELVEEVLSSPLKIKEAPAPDLVNISYDLNTTSKNERVTKYLSSLDTNEGVTKGWTIGFGAMVTALSMLLGHQELSGDIASIAGLDFISIILLIVGGVAAGLLAFASGWTLRAISYAPPFLVLPLIGALISPLYALIFFAVSYLGVIAEASANQALKLHEDREGFGRWYAAKKNDVGRNLLIQAENAAKQDPRGFFPIGIARGFTRKEYYDPYGYSEGIEVGFHPDDLGLHTLVTGSTGTGKTFSAVRPLALALRESYYRMGRRIGMLILCGKSKLQDDFEGIGDYINITPLNKLTPLSIMEGLDASTFATVFFSATKPPNQNSDYFEKSGEALFRNGAQLLEYMKETDPTGVEACKHEDLRGWWTIDALNLFMISLNDERPLYDVIIKHLDDHYRKNKIKPGNIYRVARKFFDESIRNMPDEQKKGVTATAELMMKPFYSTSELAEWTACAHGVNPAACLQGEMIGVQVPEKWGEVSEIIIKLVKARIFRAAKDRPNMEHWHKDEKWDNETRCMMIMDEAQKIIDKQDVRAIDVVRSVGLSLFYCTQSIDALETALGSSDKSTLFAFLNNINTAISFSSSEDTYDWLSTKGRTMFRHDGNAEVFDNTAHNEYNRTTKFSIISIAEGVSQSAQMMGIAKRNDGGMGGLSEHASKNAGVGHGEFRNYKTMAAFTKEEISQQLQIERQAIFICRRAGVVRRDIIDLSKHPIEYTPEAFMDRWQGTDAPWVNTDIKATMKRINPLYVDPDEAVEKPTKKNKAPVFIDELSPEQMSVASNDSLRSMMNDTLNALDTGDGEPSEDIKPVSHDIDLGALSLNDDLDATIREKLRQASQKIKEAAES